jgi:hypothetical protein
MMIRDSGFEQASYCCRVAAIVTGGKGGGALQVDRERFD